MINTITSKLVENAAREWVKLYKLKPILTSFMTVIIGATFAAGITYLDNTDRQSRELKRLENINYETQVNQLDDMENNVRELLSFVVAQKKTVQETEDAITNLKSEHQKLKPLVETDKAIVEAFFQAQEERVSSNVWRERWIGFGFGIVASLVASFIWFVVAMLMNSRHNKPIKQD